MDSLIRYAEAFLTLPYKWGGDDPILGYDCSGFVQEVLASVGIDPIGDQTAHGLWKYFWAHGYKLAEPKAGALAFYGSPQKITHVALCMDPLRCIEAAGGGSTTHTEADAAKQNAYLRIRPVRRRKDLQMILMPKYPKSMVGVE
jgi:cell wall-associated NlpC family hydrolase